MDQFVQLIFYCLDFALFALHVCNVLFVVRAFFVNLEVIFVFWLLFFEINYILTAKSDTAKSIRQIHDYFAVYHKTENGSD